jgi:hypothetical protein
LRSEVSLIKAYLEDVDADVQEQMDDRNKDIYDKLYTPAEINSIKNYLQDVDENSQTQINDRNNDVDDM